MIGHSLIMVGVVGVLLDIILHVLQMFPHLLPTTVRKTAAITLLSCLLGGLSLIPQWNLPLLLMEGFVGVLAVVSFALNKEVCEHG